MKKVVFVLCLLSNVCFADVLSDKVRGLMGEREYSANSNFINKIFADKNSFYTNGSLNIAKIVQSLKNNGLLHLKFSAPAEVNLTFSARTSPILLSRTTNDILTTMGYTYFNVQKAQYNNGLASITFTFSTEHAPDPLVIVSAAQRRGLNCIDIKRVNLQKWEYLLELESLQIPNSTTLTPAQSTPLRDVSGQYWINIQTQGTLQISNPQKWYPRIVLYDRNLVIVDTILESKSPQNNTSVKIPQGVSFVYITDANNPSNLKKGITAQFN